MQKRKTLLATATALLLVLCVASAYPVYATTLSESYTFTVSQLRTGSAFSLVNHYYGFSATVDFTKFAIGAAPTNATEYYQFTVFNPAHDGIAYSVTYGIDGQLNESIYNYTAWNKLTTPLYSANITALPAKMYIQYDNNTISIITDSSTIYSHSWTSFVLSDMNANGAPQNGNPSGTVTVAVTQYSAYYPVTDNMQTIVLEFVPVIVLFAMLGMIFGLIKKFTGGKD